MAALALGLSRGLSVLMGPQCATVSSEVEIPPHRTWFLEARILLTRSVKIHLLIVSIEVQLVLYGHCNVALWVTQ